MATRLCVRLTGDSPINTENAKRIIRRVRDTASKFGFDEVDMDRMITAYESAALSWNEEVVSAKQRICVPVPPV